MRFAEERQVCKAVMLVMVTYARLLRKCPEYVGAPRNDGRRARYTRAGMAVAASVVHILTEFYLIKYENTTPSTKKTKPDINENNIAHLFPCPRSVFILFKSF